MHPKNANQSQPGSGASKACWECIRRTIDCDGGRPVCKKCLESGIVCPGFDNKKPLVWVTPGKVTHRAPQRLRRKTGFQADDASKSKGSTGTKPVHAARGNTKTATVLTIRSQSSGQASSPTSSNSGDYGTICSPKAGQQTAGSSDFGASGWSSDSGECSKVLAKQDRHSFNSADFSFSSKFYSALQLANTVPTSLLAGDYELVGALDYYVSQIYMPIAKKQVIHCSHIPPTTSVAELLPGVQSPCRRHALLALVSAHHVSAASGKLPHGTIHTESCAKSYARRFYHHLGRALQELKMELSRKEVLFDLGIFSTILKLLITEVSQGEYWGTLAHINGFLALVELRGGLRKLMSEQGSNLGGLQVFTITCVFTYATSPSKHQLVKTSQMDMGDLYSLYTWSAMPHMLCSPHLFLDMVRINRLRFEAATIPFIMEDGNLGQTAFHEILNDIWSFSPESWAQSTGFPHEDRVALVGRVFQYAMAFYAIKSLQDGTDSYHLFRELNGGGLLPKNKARLLFFEMVEQVIDSLYLESMGWPLTVAGVIAETPSERAAVIQNIGKMTNYIGFGSPLRFLIKVLEDFWASGKSGWDNCFYKVHYFI